MQVETPSQRLEKIRNPLQATATTQFEDHEIVRMWLLSMKAEGGYEHSRGIANPNYGHPPRLCEKIEALWPSLVDIGREILDKNNQGVTVEFDDWMIQYGFR